ncbi:MAG: GtrA family protein [Lachnospiraceae bacterium]|nr:GtrA family protein [Lachnospiraceae bacterium]
MKKELLSYLFFGVCTTAVNFITYFILDSFTDYRIANALAWLVSVLFAFVTNKIWVFKSRSCRISVIFQELCAFTGGRIISGLFDMGFLIAAVEWIHLDGGLAKILDSVIVVILNYIFSKLFVFRNQ